MSKVSQLEPKSVFHFFEEICEIPHGSGNVERISNYLVDFAKERNLAYFQDELKNVVIIKEATAGYEKEAMRVDTLATKILNPHFYDRK